MCSTHPNKLRKKHEKKPVIKYIATHVRESNTGENVLGHLIHYFKISVRQEAICKNLAETNYNTDKERTEPLISFSHSPK